MISRYNAEQYIWLSALRTHVPVNCEHGWDDTPENKRLTELTFANNLIVADEARSGVTFCKYRPSRILQLVCYTHEDWLDLYRRYCDPTYPVGGAAGRWWRHAGRLTEIIGRKVCVRLPQKLRWVGGPLGRN